MTTSQRSMVDVFGKFGWILLVLYGCVVAYSDALELDSCNEPLGMESRKIPDSAISASSAYDSGSVGAHHGRLKDNKQGGAWCPRHMVSRDASEFLEINLESVYVIIQTKTQGRYGNGQGQEYAEEYMLEYWRPGFTKWVRWKDRQKKELLPGNTNTFTIVQQQLDPPIIASKVRFLPYSDHVRTVCMRVELIGCPWTDGLISYGIPQGVHRGNDIDLTDRTYDGKEENGRLSQGLGQLVDGQKGKDNFRLDLTGQGKGYEWVGWRNDTPGWAGHPLEMLFEFDKVRNFSAAHVHTNNVYSKDVQVFSHARAFVSINGNTFSPEPVHFSYMPDLILEHARNVTIKLHNRIGKFLKLQLYFATRWILISEVSFSSTVASGNFTESEEEVALPPDANGREYPPQRDEVKAFEKTNDGGNDLSHGSPVYKSDGSNEEPKHYIGFVIGVLTVIILILVAAIIFIVFRNQRLKAVGASATALPQDLQRTDGDEKIKMEEDNKDVYTETSCRPPSIYGRQIIQYNSPDYSEVPDLVNQELSSQSSSSRALSSSANFSTQPPPIPPPPTNYYGHTEPGMPTKIPQIARQPTLNDHFMLPLSPEPDEGIFEADDDVTIKTILREKLTIIEKIGEGDFGDVHLCELLDRSNLDDESKDNYNSSRCNLVVVHSLRSEAYREEFYREIKALSRLENTNIARLLGTCQQGNSQHDAVCAVREYTPFGDLCQFLQDHVAESATPLAPTARTLSYGSLIYMATQIASGMKYMEMLRYVHKDLATRNCLVGNHYEIKVSDLGSYRQMYSSDYCRIADSKPLPIRWMSWESILSRKFSSKSDVWSFAVLLWEILTFAREQPFEEFSDDKVLENVAHFYQDDGKHVLLNVPINCPREVFDLMCECWQRNDSDRPTFREIHLFLQRKNLGFNRELH